MLNLEPLRTAPLRRERGFSLLELAIVLLIVGLLLGGLIMPLGSRMDQQRIDTTRQQLEQIREALTGYALANDALPCPATPASGGQAAATATGWPSIRCTSQMRCSRKMSSGQYGLGCAIAAPKRVERGPARQVPST